MRRRFPLWLSRRDEFRVPGCWYEVRTTTLTIVRSLLRRLTGRPSLIGALVLVVSAAVVVFANWDPIVHGHPSYLFFYLALLGLGAGVTVAGLRGDASRRRIWSVTGAAGLVLLAAGGLWLAPFVATESAIAVLEEPGGPSITESWTSIILEPESGDETLGMVFHPGAKVDARAYAGMLKPLAEAGFTVVIVKEPLGIAFLSGGFLSSWIESHPEVGQWVVAGHSLGGVVASSQAVSEPTAGLLLWASYPASDISDATSLAVASVYGTNDGLSEPERVEASADDLPPGTLFTAVEGAVHSHFGDYGLQPGDGEPGVDRETAQDRIVDASLDFLEELSGGSPGSG